MTRRLAERTIGIAIGTIVVLLVAYGPTLNASASQPRKAPLRCSDSQLAVATESIVGAGGSDGFAVLIANQSRRSCAIEGYAHVSFFNSVGGPIKVKVIHRGSMLFRTVVPRRLVLTPSSVDSFAVSYGENFNPSNDSASRCEADLMTVELPTIHPKFYPEGDLSVLVKVDVCLADGSIGLTPIEGGARVQGP
jgi:hypothetical protein